MSKKSFYCWYLGFTEAYGPHGHIRVYEVIHNILKYYYQIDKSFALKLAASNNSGSGISFNDFNNLNIQFNSLILPSKITLCLNDNCLTIIDSSHLHGNSSSSAAAANGKKLSKKASSAPKVDLMNKAYAIGYDDITFVFRMTNRPYADIVTFIVRTPVPSSFEFTDNRHNFQQQTHTFNLHAFRCDSEESAVKLESYLLSLRHSYMAIVEKKRDKLLKKQQSGDAKKLNEQRKTKNNANSIHDTMISVSDSAHLYNNKLKNSFLKRQIFRVFSNNINNATTTNNNNEDNNNTNNNSSNGSTPLSNFSSNKNSVQNSCRQQLDNNSSSGEYTNLSSSSQNDLVGSETNSSDIQSSGSVVRRNLPYYLKTSTDQIIPVYPKHLMTTESADTSSSSSSTNIIHQISPTYFKKVKMLEHVNKEMSEKFRSGQPILYPPKDYSKIDRVRGDLEEAANRSSQNPVIVGDKEALNAKIKNNSRKTKADFSDMSETGSLREQTDQALKLLDDVVNSELVDITMASISSDGMTNSEELNTEQRTNTSVYQFIPPPQNQVKPNNSFSHLKNKPAEKLDSKSSTNHQQFEQINEDNGGQLFYKKNANAKLSSTSKVSKNATACKKTNSIISNMTSNLNQIINNSNNNNKLSNSSSKTTVEQQAAANGIRNGILSRLASYQPQWLSDTNANACSSNSAFFRPSFCEISQAPRYEQKAVNKLRHCLSARINREASSNQKTKANQQPSGKSLKQSLSFLRKDVIREASNESLTPHQQFCYAPDVETRQQQFALKPAKSNHDINSFYFKDLSPNNLNQRFFSNYKEVSMYKSESSLASKGCCGNGGAVLSARYDLNNFFY